MVHHVITALMIQGCLCLIASLAINPRFHRKSSKVKTRRYAHGYGVSRFGQCQDQQQGSVSNTDTTLASTLIGTRKTRPMLTTAKSTNSLLSEGVSLRMHKEDAIIYIIDHACNLPANEAMACHMAASDLQEHGLEEWIEWPPTMVINTFIEIMDESSETSMNKLKSYAVGESFIDELFIEGYIGEGEEDQDRVDYIKTMEGMRESMISAVKAMRAYFEIQQVIKIKYYGLH
jgi:hypothetical protein